MDSKQVKFLEELGCDKKKHGKGKYSLLEHLKQVQQILKSENSPEYLQLAGLFHSVYGTPVFKHKSTQDRDSVRELIGEEAEKIVYEFSKLSKPRFRNIHTKYRGQLKQDLLKLTRANLKSNHQNFE